MGAASEAWTAVETDGQRLAILSAADRLLAGTPRRSTGNLSVLQLAIEAGVKYWVVAQKHPDLREHFQDLAAKAKKTPAAFRKKLEDHDQLRADHARLKEHCAGIEELLRTYAVIINELTLENHRLSAAAEAAAGVTSLSSRSRRSSPG